MSSVICVCSPPDSRMERTASPDMSPQGRSCECALERFSDSRSTTRGEEPMHELRCEIFCPASLKSIRMADAHNCVMLTNCGRGKSLVDPNRPTSLPATSVNVTYITPTIRMCRRPTSLQAIPSPATLAQARPKSTIAASEPPLLAHAAAPARTCAACYALNSDFRGDDVAFDAVQKAGLILNVQVRAATCDWKAE